MKTIVGYGVGLYYDFIKEELNQVVKLDYLCDKKFDEEQVKEYNGFRTITRDKLANLKDVLVIIMVRAGTLCELIRNELENSGLTVVHVDEIIGKQISWSGQVLKRDYPEGKYEDSRGNSICFDETLPDKLVIAFVGCNNKVTIGANLRVGHGDLYIRLGSNGVCVIGENTIVNGALFYVSEACLTIGDDCLMSTEVIIRTHDHHHIFDKNTHRRINFAKDVSIGNHVWIAQRVILLGGARIGEGSVVGAGAITSSQFGEHQIIVGAPAKCIRENICWSKDDTDYSNWTYLEECKSQEALKYL